MVIDNFNIFRTCIRPTKTDTPLIIDTNAVLPRTIILECFKVIPGWHPQIIQSAGNLKLSKFTSGNLTNIHKLPYRLAL
jgi:hypothetical protein